MVGLANARSAVPVVRLYDVPNHIREVALHGVRHGAAMALAAAQARFGHELRLLPYGFPALNTLRTMSAWSRTFSTPPIP